MIVLEKIVYTFNKLYGNFLRDVKDCDPIVKAAIKANYKIIVKSSYDYINAFKKELEHHISSYSKTNDALKDIEIFKDIKIGLLLDKIGGGDNEVKVWNYITILSALTVLYKDVFDSACQEIGDSTERIKEVLKEEDGEVLATETETELDDLKKEVEEIDAEESEADTKSDVYGTLFDKIIRIFAMSQKGEDFQSEAQEILDDDIKNILMQLTVVKVESNQTINEDIGNIFGSLENSKICNLAKEISKEIDVSDIKIESPQDIFKLMDFSGKGGGNNVIGNIIGKVSSKIQEKIGQGELKHEDLLSEAMSMMSMMNGGAGGSGGMGGMAGLFNNPMMAEMMKSMKKGKVNTKADVFKREATRDKLRRKLEERRKEKE